MSIATRLIRWVRRMLGLSINLTTTRVGGLATIPGATGSASFLDGAGNTVTAPILGQPLFIAPGTFSGTPTVYDYQVYAAGVAIGDATGTWDAADPAPVFIPDDALVGLALSVKCHGRNSSGTSPTTNDSAATTALADISLTNAITAFTRTSASGVTPMTWSLTLAANVFEGYTLRAKVYSDSGLSTLTQNVPHIITGPDMVASATIDLTSDGLTAPTATQWLQLTVEATSPNGIFYSYTHATALSPTDAAVAMTWSATDAATISATLSGGNLTVTRGGGYANCKGSRGLSADGDYYWEVTPTAGLEVSVADASAVLTDYWAPAFAGGTATTHAAGYSGNDGAIYYNTGSTAVATAGAGAVIGVCLRIGSGGTVRTVWFLKNNVALSGVPFVSGGQAMASISSPIYPAVQVGGGNSATANFGTTPGGTAGFTYTPPGSAVAP